MVDVLVELSLDRGIHLLFQLTPDVNFKKPGRYILHMAFSYQFFMEWTMVRKLIIREGRLQSYYEVMAKLLSDKTPSLQLIERVVTIDNTLITASLPNEGDRVNMSSNYVHFADLKNLTGSPSMTGKFLHAVNRLLPSDRQMTVDDEIWVHHGGYLRYLGTLLGENPESETLRGYVGLLLARYLAPAASSSIASEHTPIRGLPMFYMLGHCILNVVVTLPYIMGDLFVRWSLEETELAEISDMVTLIRNATRAGFQGKSWMDLDTRTRAVDRLADLGRFVGRPDNLTTAEMLNQHYSFLATAEGPYATMLEVTRDAESARKKDLLKSPTPFFPAINIELPTILVNAFYVPIYHIMVIPPAIMFAPFYKSGLPLAFNYGSLGHVIGHEITHAFDPELNLYNASGLREDWWTPDTRKAIDARLQCLKDIYNQVPWASGVNYGDTAVSENFADCGGLERVHRAYDALGDHSVQKLGDKSYTGKQTFFITSCYKWCASTPPAKYTEDMVKVKIYSPMKMRCNVPLMNTPEFATAFRCAAGTLMNPEKRCDVF
ncbi:endothelin-converting enzyme homolog [Ixodes scapularis]|uniref:endothelin-converting enzyme homolog n=1 Tax=Ixodes scapularis TaxID=6945 RepID=UPI001C380390|nr:endothelin-converting enzyme homolog [Ixodes scapularis]